MNKKQFGNASNHNLDRNLKPRPEVSLSAFAYLFSEITQNLMKKDQKDIESELHDLGFPIG